jgi:hypothetical protein
MRWELGFHLHSSVARRFQEGQQKISAWKRILYFFPRELLDLGAFCLPNLKELHRVVWKNLYEYCCWIFFSFPSTFCAFIMMYKCEDFILQPIYSTLTYLYFYNVLLRLFSYCHYSLQGNNLTYKQSRRFK